MSGPWRESMVLGLTAPVMVCLFNLNGVLTDTAVVVGVDRVGQAAALRSANADIVVQDLAELLDGSR